MISTSDFHENNVTSFEENTALMENMKVVGKNMGEGGDVLGEHRGRDAPLGGLVRTGGETSDLTGNNAVHSDDGIDNAAMSPTRNKTPTLTKKATKKMGRELGNSYTGRNFDKTKKNFVGV